MNSADNIKPLFSMDEDRLQFYQERLANSGIDAGAELEKINCPEAMENAGRRDMVLHGLALLILIGALSFTTSNDYLAFTIIIGIGIAIAAARTAMAFKKSMRSTKIREEAVRKQIALEGDDGFLWRFEPFLSDWDVAPPKPVAQSLRPICAISKQVLPMPEYHELRAYWYWVSAVQKNLD